MLRSPLLFCIACKPMRGHGMESPSCVSFKQKFKELNKGQKSDKIQCLVMCEERCEKEMSDNYLSSRINLPGRGISFLFIFNFIFSAVKTCPSLMLSIRPIVTMFLSEKHVQICDYKFYFIFFVIRDVFCLE